MAATVSMSENKSLPLPENKLPKCWWDLDELSYFFSPFRSYAQNPLDKENKLKFWKPLIHTWCDHHKRCTFTLSELVKAFQKESLVPACLRDVLEEMLRSGELRLKSNFMEMPQQTWSGWAVDVLVKKPVVWSFRKAIDLVITTKEEEIRYVHIAVTKSQAEAVMLVVGKNNEGNLLTHVELEHLCQKFDATKELEIVIHWLLRQGSLATSGSGDSMVIKFAGINEKVTAITDLDLGMHMLKHTERTLTRQLEELEAEKLATVQVARNYVAKGMRQMAKSCLKKKQELEKSVAKRASALDNVQVLLSRVNEAQADTKILESYRQGVGALKMTFKEADLTEDSVSNTMLQVNEMLDIHDDIQDALSQSVGASSEEELENELAELLLDDTSSPTKMLQTPTKQMLSALEDLPSPPSHNLSPLQVNKIPDAPTTQLAM